MGNVIGSAFDEYVDKQVKVRQKVIGKPTLNDKELQYINSKTAFLRLSSAVNITQDIAEFLGYGNLGGDKLAKKIVLWNGVTSLEADESKNKLKFHENPEQVKFSNPLSGISSIDNLNSAYGFGGNQFGYRPMPTLESAKTSFYNRGSLQKASINIKAFNVKQLELIEVLYMKLGYSILLEWGHTMYLDNEGSIVNMTTDFSNSPLGLLFNEAPFNFSKLSFKDKFKHAFGGDVGPLPTNKPDQYMMYMAIQDERKKYYGNYDAFFGKITNFNWKFNSDGTYDITLSAISMGDIIESLMITNNIEEDEFDAQEKKRVKDLENEDVYLDYKTGKFHNISEFREDGDHGDLFSGGPLNELERRYAFEYIRQGAPVSEIDPDKWNLDMAEKDLEQYKNFGLGNVIVANKNRSELDTWLFSILNVFNPTNSKEDLVHKKEVQYKKKMLNSIIGKDLYLLEYRRSKFYDTIRVNTQNVEFPYIQMEFISEQLKASMNEDDDKKTYNIDTNQTYVKLGLLLKKLEEISNLYNGETKYIQFDYNFKTNYCLTYPDQFAADPKICIIPMTNSSKRIAFKHDKLTKKQKELLAKSMSISGRASGLLAEGGEYSTNFKGITNDKWIQWNWWSTTGKQFKANDYLGRIMHIHVNLNFISSTLQGSMNKGGEVDLYTFLKNLLNGISKNLGGQNKLSVAFDSSQNKLTIREDAPLRYGGAEGAERTKKPLTKFQIYKIGEGYGSFVKDIGFNVTVPSNMATMVAVGAQSEGNQPGVNATAFSILNKGLTDRIIPNKEYKSTKKIEKDKDKAHLSKEFLFMKDYNLAERMLSSVYGYRRILGNSTSTLMKLGRKIGSQVVGELSNELIPSPFFIPFDLKVTMDGLAGMQIFQKYSINEDILPSTYRERGGQRIIDFLIKGISHDISNNQWTTTIESLAAPVDPNVGIPKPVDDAKDELGDVKQSEVPIGKAETGERAEKIVIAIDFLKGKGATVEGAAGLVGNLIAESNLKLSNLEKPGKSVPSTNKYSNSQGGNGIAQWTGVRRTTWENAIIGSMRYTIKNRTAYEKAIRDKGLDAQLEFLWNELKTSYKPSFKSITTSSDTSKTAVKVVQDFERPLSWLSYHLPTRFQPDLSQSSKLSNWEEEKNRRIQLAVNALATYNTNKGKTS